MGDSKPKEKTFVYADRIDEGYPVGDLLEAAHYDLVGTNSVNIDDKTVNGAFLVDQAAEINAIFEKIGQVELINQAIQKLPELVKADLTVLVKAYQVAKAQPTLPNNVVAFPGTPNQAGNVPTVVAVQAGALNVMQQAVQNQVVNNYAYHENPINQQNPQQNILPNQNQPNPYVAMAFNLNQQVQAFHNVNTNTYGLSYTNLITNLENSGALKYILKPEVLEALMPMLEQMTPEDKAAFMEVLNQINSLALFTVGKSKQYLQNEYALLQQRIGAVSSEEARSYLTKELTKLERAIEKAKTANANVMPFPKNPAPLITQLNAA